jgi:ADP-ribosyl-[dinitrogen reductase] hydrolase
MDDFDLNIRFAFALPAVLDGRKGRASRTWPDGGRTGVDEDKLLDRARGCLLGQLCGDALGSAVEFSAASSIVSKYPNGLREIIPSPVWNTIAGQPTDDSEMALALARTLVQFGFDIEKVAGAYGQWLQSNPFDVGGTILKATSGIVEATMRGERLELAVYDKANWESEANGALMRQSPLAIWGWALPKEELAAIVKRDTALTHPNRVCRDASAALIVAMSTAIREGLNARATYEVAQEWDTVHGTSPSVTEAIEKASGEKPDFGKHSGHVIVALQNALFQLLHADSLEEGVVATVMAGGDTDTNAAIAGSLLGAVYGLGSIPPQWWRAVLNCQPEEGRAGVAHPRPQMYWPIDAPTLALALVEATRPHDDKG